MPVVLKGWPGLILDISCTRPGRGKSNAARFLSSVFLPVNTIHCLSSIINKHFDRIQHIYLIYFVHFENLRCAKSIRFPAAAKGQPVVCKKAVWFFTRKQAVYSALIKSKRPAEAGRLATAEIPAVK